ncbi:MAG: adenylate/guanylate cyclase domain-containing protein, partial [Alphaproteobacteria bacterium]
MAEKRVQRRLAAILAADVVGYSRLIESDETGTRARLRNLHSELIEPRIAEDGGRIVKTSGDGVLVEFASAVDAVRNALSVQREMRQRNETVPEDRRIEFRVGINLGDVIVEGDDIHGDGVNVAARLEGLCEPGEVYISGTIYDNVEGKLAATFDNLGEKTVKNIAKPVRVYRARDATSEEARQGIAATAPSPPLPDMPSIAVLPFANMSGDAEQEFFADGITEDILTELSRFRDLFVISRTSAFKYKGKALNIQEVARELGAQYVVEGGVRKAGNRVRVTAQLIDAETDRHVWAERYDRDLEDIFAIQDEISQAIVATLPGRVEAARRERTTRKPTNNMAAYELVLGAKVLHHRSNRRSNQEALDMAERAIAMDQKYAHAHAWKACILGQAWRTGWAEDDEAVWNEVVNELQTALALDDNDSDVHRILAAVHVTRCQFDKAVFHEDRALTLNPNDDLIVVQKGELLTWLGQPEEGISWIEKAMRLNPYHPERFWSHLGRAYFVARRYPEAVAAFQKIGAPDYGHHAFLAAASAQSGDEAAARAHANQVLTLEPGFSIASYLETMHYRNEVDRAHHRDSLL